MIYEGCERVRDIDTFLSWENSKNVKGDVIGFQKNYFKFSQKYLLSNNYNDFILKRKQEINSKNLNNSNKFMAYLKSLFITRSDLLFTNDSENHEALFNFIGSLLPIVQNKNSPFVEERNDIYSDFKYLDRVYADFYNNDYFLDNRTFQIIQKYAEKYLFWVTTETNHNATLKMKQSIENF